MKKKLSPPSPVEHPNAFFGISTASLTTLLIYECNTRLGMDITELEAGTIITVVTGLLLYLGKGGA